MLLRIYSSLGSRPSLFDRRWVCGFGRSGKLGRCRALLAQRTRLGACRRLPMLFRFELCSYDSAFVGCSRGTAAILKTLAGDGIGPAWNAGGAISRRVARFGQLLARGHLAVSGRGWTRRRRPMRPLTKVVLTAVGRARYRLLPRRSASSSQSDCISTAAQCTVVPGTYSGSVFGAAYCALPEMS